MKELGIDMEIVMFSACNKDWNKLSNFKVSSVKISIIWQLFLKMVM